MSESTWKYSGCTGEYIIDISIAQLIDIPMHYQIHDTLTDTQGIVARDDSRKEIIVSFRGSEHPIDFVVGMFNFNIFQQYPCRLGSHTDEHTRQTQSFHLFPFHLPPSLPRLP